MCTHGEKISAEGCSVGRGRQKRHMCKGGEGSLSQMRSSTLAVVGLQRPCGRNRSSDCSEQSDQTTGEKSMA